MTAAASAEIDIGLGGGVVDPFSKGVSSKVHIRVQQRNGRKCITTIQGLDADLDLRRICRAMKRAFNCNGSVEESAEMGEVIQLQGDQRDLAKDWLIDQEILTRAEAEDRLVLHGF